MFYHLTNNKTNTTFSNFSFISLIDLKKKKSLTILPILAVPSFPTLIFFLKPIWSGFLSHHYTLETVPVELPMITLLLSAMIDSQYSFLLIDCNIGYSLLPSVISFAWLGAGHTFLLFLLPYWLLFLRHTRWFFLIFTTSKHWATPGLSSLFKLVSLVISSSLMTLDTIYMLMTQKFMSAAWIYPNF